MNLTKYKFIKNQRLDQGYPHRVSLAYQLGTLTITLECLLCLYEAIIEPYSCMGDPPLSNSFSSIQPKNQVTPLKKLEKDVLPLPLVWVNYIKG